jgi:hypothetical protein
MAKLSTKARKRLPKGKFAGPNRSYPIPDKSHAANAKARATQAVKAGRMSASQAASIKAKANKVLGKSAGGAKKKSGPKLPKKTTKRRASRKGY